MFDDEHQSVFVFRNPLRFLSRKGRQIGAYLSGGLVNGETRIIARKKKEFTSHFTT
jgi:hypothetical protein